MTNERTLQNYALVLLLGVSGNLVFINYSSAQRSISVSPFLGKVVTTYSKEVRGSASTYGYSGYGAQLLYSEPGIENTDSRCSLPLNLITQLRTTPPAVDVTTYHLALTLIR